MPDLFVSHPSCEEQLVGAFREGKCPDCGADKFHEGPRGGLATNVQCLGCLSWFNVSIFGGPVFFVQRIHNEPTQ